MATRNIDYVTDDYQPMANADVTTDDYQPMANADVTDDYQPMAELDGSARDVSGLAGLMVGGDAGEGRLVVTLTRARCQDAGCYFCLSNAGTNCQQLHCEYARGIGGHYSYKLSSLTLLS
jgi:hypothetical protein